MSEPKTMGFAICRSARDPLKPGFKLGYECRICKAPLQVSPHGLARIAEEEAKGREMLVMCNACGFDMQRRLAERGVTIDEEFSSEAIRQMIESRRVD